jgi:thioredoxin-related protein
MLPDRLSTTPGTVNVVLFSQEGCPFCAIVRRHYLEPLAAERRARIQVCEVELGNQRILRDFAGRTTSHDAFARTYDVRFAPTVTFLGANGVELAGRIVGLSQDYFGAYLETAIASALAAGP